MSIAEFEKLWQCATYTAGTTLELLGDLTAMDAPGDVLTRLQRLHARLGDIIETRKARTHASEDSQE